MAGLKAFREAYLSAAPQDEADWGDFEARRLRYQILWALYENTAYRNIHKWTTAYRTQYGLYKYVRNIYNPAYRLGEFWKNHIWGGLLDPAAGDGEEVPSAVPIVIPEENASAEALRSAIAHLWQWSNWQVLKDIVTLHGAVQGDIGIRIIDDTERKRVYLGVVQPGTLKSMTRDPFGNVKAYAIQESRPHPQKASQTVTYLETAERDGENVVYRTFLNGKPYAWNGEAPEWAEPYGFVPLVVIQHNNVGLEWGWSELHPGRSKIHEVDDLASMLSDQIRKTVNVIWFFAGMSKPKTTPKVTEQDATVDRPEPAREELPALYSPKEGAKAQALVAPLDIAAVNDHIGRILAELERDYPELQMDIWTAQETRAAASGRALRLARQRTEIKVAERRVNYDDALRRAEQMAVAIGGFRKYEGYEGFDLKSYEQGLLEHSIGKRPVFAADPLDDLEREELFWKTAESAVRSGASLGAYLKWQGWEDERIAELYSSPEYAARLAQMQAAVDGFEAMRGERG